MPEITLRIVFPLAEFRKAMSQFSDVSSIQYQVKGSFFYLGTVQSAYKQSSREILFILEIRKDETPVWYARKIIENAQKQEIYMMKDSKSFCSGGRIVNVKGLDDSSDNDTVELLEAMTVAREPSTRQQHPGRREPEE